MHQQVRVRLPLDQTPERSVSSVRLLQVASLAWPTSAVRVQTTQPPKRVCPREQVPGHLHEGQQGGQAL